MSILFDSAVSIAAALRARELSAVELVSEAIARIDRFNPELNAIIWRNDEEALAAARAADARIADGGDLPRFLGVPLPIKELTMVRGQPGTFGSRGVSDAPRPVNDLVVDAFLDAGFVLLGRSNSPEAGPMSVTENQRFGTTLNPWDVRFSPAGSSGGAAVAVATGMTPVAHATDGGGSIRMPASATGLVGLKPSRGRIAARVPAWEHSIAEGVITRHVIDTAAILDTLSHPDRTTAYSAPALERPLAEEVGAPSAQLRIGLMLDAPGGLHVDSEAREAALDLARALERLGHVVEPVQPVLYSAEAMAGFVDVIINAWLWVTPYDEPELAEPYIRARRDRATEHHAGEYAQAAARVSAESQAIVAQWGRDFDVLLTPTMATTPPLAGTVLAEANRDFTGIRLRENQMVAFTMMANISGLPAISLPVRTSVDGLPIGAQLIGGPFGEAELIRLASAVEPHFGWTDRIPPGYR